MLQWLEVLKYVLCHPVRLLALHSQGRCGFILLIQRSPFHNNCILGCNGVLGGDRECLLEAGGWTAIISSLL